MTRDTRKVIGFTVCIAVLLVAIGLLAWATSGFKNWDAKTWFNYWGKGALLVTVPEEPDPGELVLTPNTQSSIAVYAARSSSNETAAQADDSYVLTAIIDPDTGWIPQLEWTMDFTDPTATWAADKTASDYVSLDVSEDTSSATITLLKPFKVQITVTVRIIGLQTDLSGSCTLDYVGRFSAVRGSYKIHNKAESIPFVQEGSESITSVSLVGYKPDVIFTTLSSTRSGTIAAPFVNQTYSLLPTGAYDFKITTALSESFLAYLQDEHNQSGFGLNALVSLFAGSPVAPDLTNTPRDFISVSGQLEDLSLASGNRGYTLWDFSAPNTTDDTLVGLIGTIFPQVLAPIVETPLLPVNPEEVFKTFLQFLSNYANSTDIPDTDKYNFDLKLEFTYNGVTTSAVAKLFLDYDYPLDSVTLNPDSIIF